MSDRTYCRIAVHKDDEIAFCKAMARCEMGSFPGEFSFDCVFNDVERHGNEVSGSIDGANYGYFDEWETIAKETTLKFYGHHGSGYDYEACEFASEGNGLYWVAVGVNGYIMVGLDENTLEVYPIDLQAAKDYIKVRNAVYRYLTI